MTCKENTFIKTPSDCITDRSTRKYNTTDEAVDTTVALMVHIDTCS